jgi:uncharacterized protein
MKFLKIIAVLLASFVFLAGCATYTDSTKLMNAELSAGNYNAALQKLDASGVAKSQTDFVLYKMERGQILYLQELYEESAKEWSLALKKTEELYTTSLKNQAASFAINDSFADYEGEWHERIMLPVFSATAYMAAGEPKKAIVEIRKTNEVLNRVEELSKGNTKISDLVFARFMSGFIYETLNNYDSAIIEYKKGIEIWQKQRGWQPREKIEPLIEALGRIAEFKQRKDILNFLKSFFPNASWKKMEDFKKYSDILVLYESGKVPVKVPKDFPFPIAGSIVNISFADYQNRYSFSNSSSVFAQGKNFGNTEIIMDIKSLSYQGLSERRTKDIAKMAARIIAKDQASRAIGRSLGPLAQIASSIAGAVSERADTRGWSSLPENIQIKRILLEPKGQETIVVRPNGMEAKNFLLNLNAGESKLVRVRTF